MDIYVYMLAATLYFAPPCWFQNKTKQNKVLFDYLKRMGTFSGTKTKQKCKNNIRRDQYCRLRILHKNVQIFKLFGISTARYYREQFYSLKKPTIWK